MGLTNPNIIAKPIVGANGQVTASSQVIRDDNTNIETGLFNVESTTLGWEFAESITNESDPGAGNFALNNADKNLATTITLNRASSTGAARFDEVLTGLKVGDRVFMKQRSAAASTSVLYRVTAAPNLVGNRVNVTVAAEQNEGSAGTTFTDQAFVAVTFFFTAAAGQGTLTQPQQDWLANIASQQLSTTSVTNIAPTVEDVLIWRRAAIVTQSGINDPGTGLLIAEANRQSDGTFIRTSGTAVYDDDLANAYIYVGITTNDFNITLDTANTFLEARRPGITEPVFSSSLDDLTTPTQVTSGQFVYKRTTNNQYHYIDGDVLTVVTRATSSTTQYLYTTPEGDFTQNVSELPFSAVDSQFDARVRGSSDTAILTPADRVKLTGLLVSTTTSAGQAITVLYKEGKPSGTIADYDKTWNAANPVLGNFGATRTVSILVDNNVTVTSISGGATLGDQLLWIPGKYIYEVTIPAEVSTGTPTSHLPTGTTEAFLPSGFNDNFKIVRGNVGPILLAAIDAHGNTSDISSLQSQVDGLAPLLPDVSILNAWADIYDPIHGAATVDIASGYDLGADFRSVSDRYESAGVTYGTGTNVITYTGLSESLFRSFAFKIGAPANKTLMFITDGAEQIPFVDTTAAGNIRVNNFIARQENDQVITDQYHFLTRTSGPATVGVGGATMTFTVTPFPSGSTNRSRRIQILPDIFFNGTDAMAGRPVLVDAPATNTALAKQTVQDSIYLGPLFGNRTVNITIGYEYRVSGADLLLDLTLEAAQVSGGGTITVGFEPSTATLLSYTSTSVVGRTDRWINLNGLSGDITYSTDAEFILSGDPVIGQNGQNNGYVEFVPVINTGGSVQQLNNVTLGIPSPLWSDIQVADDIEFRTWRSDHYMTHSFLASLLSSHATQKWIYGLFRLQTVNAGHSITEIVDLAAGSTIGGAPIGPGTVKAETVVYEALNKTTGTDGLVSSVALPANYATFKYVHITEYDVTNLQFRHAEFPTYILSAGLVDTNDNVRLQGNTVVSWTAGTRTLAMNPVAQEILRVTLKD